MRLLVIADPHIPVPPHYYGGSERIVATLCEGLASRGHVVDLMAGPGSRPFGQGRLHVHCNPTSARPNRIYRKIRFQLESLFASRSADVIVNHGRCDYLSALLRTQIPVAIVFHNPVLQSDIGWVLNRRTQNVRFIELVGNK